MKQFQIIAASAALLAVVGLAGCSNGLSLTAPNNKATINSAVVNNTDSLRVLQYKAVTGSGALTAAKNQQVTFSFNTPVDLTTAGAVTGLAINNAKAPTVAGGVWNLGTAIAYTAALDKSNPKNVVLTFDATSAASTIVFTLNGATAQNGALKLDLVGDYVGGETWDYGYLTASVTGGAAVAGGIAVQPVLPTTNTYNNAAPTYYNGSTFTTNNKITGGTFSLAAGLVTSSFADSTGTGFNNVTINKGQFDLQQFNYSTRAWTDTSITPTYNTTTGVLTYTLSTAAAAATGDTYQVLAKGPLTTLASETTAVNGFTHLLSYDSVTTSLVTSSNLIVGGAAPALYTPAGATKPTINNGVTFTVAKSTITSTTGVNQVVVKLVFSGLYNVGLVNGPATDNSTAYGLKASSITQNSVWIAATDNASGSGTAGPQTSLAWASAVTSASGTYGAGIDTIVLTFPPSLKTNGDNYSVFAYGLTDLAGSSTTVGNANALTIASLTNIPSLAVIGGSTFAY